MVHPDTSKKVSIFTLNNQNIKCCYLYLLTEDMKIINPSIDCVYMRILNDSEIINLDDYDKDFVNYDKIVVISHSKTIKYYVLHPKICQLSINGSPEKIFITNNRHHFHPSFIISQFKKK